MKQNKDTPRTSFSVNSRDSIDSRETDRGRSCGHTWSASFFFPESDLYGFSSIFAKLDNVRDNRGAATRTEVGLVYGICRTSFTTSVHPIVIRRTTSECSQFYRLANPKSSMSDYVGAPRMPVCRENYPSVCSAIKSPDNVPIEFAIENGTSVRFVFLNYQSRKHQHQGVT